jgi:hypothetical protein
LLPVDGRPCRSTLYQVRQLSGCQKPVRPLDPDPVSQEAGSGKPNHQPDKESASHAAPLKICMRVSATKSLRPWLYGIQAFGCHRSHITHRWYTLAFIFRGDYYEQNEGLSLLR